MRILQLFVAGAILIPVLGCDQNKEHRSPSNQASSEAQPVAPSPVSTGPVISNFQIALTISCQAISGQTPEVDNLAGVASVIILQSVTGRAIRLVSDPRTKPQLAQSENSYALTLIFLPENTGELEGRSITELNSVSTLKVRFSDLLRPLGLEVASGGIQNFTVTINGIEIARADLGGWSDEADGESFFSLNIAPQFGDISDKYSQVASH